MSPRFARLASALQVSQWRDRAGGARHASRPSTLPRSIAVCAPLVLMRGPCGMPPRSPARVSRADPLPVNLPFSVALTTPFDSVSPLASRSPAAFSRNASSPGRRRLRVCAQSSLMHRLHAASAVHPGLQCFALREAERSPRCVPPAILGVRRFASSASALRQARRRGAARHRTRRSVACLRSTRARAADAAEVTLFFERAGAKSRAGCPPPGEGPERRGFGSPPARFAIQWRSRLEANWARLTRPAA